MTMRLASKAREQAELPTGYQFGDAGKVAFMLSAVPIGRTGIAIRFVQQWDITPDRWRAPHLNAADRLQRTEPRT